MNLGRASKRIGSLLKSGVSTKWDGRKAILGMKEGGSRHWRQMEWIGFYFQFLCERVLSEVMTIPGPKYGNAEFDGFLEVPWDFKAHATNTSQHNVIVNDLEAVEAAIAEYGAVGVILAVGDVQYNDDDRTFQRWHSGLKGGKSKYELKRIERGAWSRLRKVRFDLKQISLIRLNRTTLSKCGSFQSAFRNADGGSRRAKVLVDLEKIREDVIHFVEF